MTIDRKRDYKFINLALFTAYNNDLINNESEVSSDELSILLTLSKELELSQEEEINQLFHPAC
jgi:hypothetical protein